MTKKQCINKIDQVDQTCRIKSNKLFDGLVTPWPQPCIDGDGGAAAELEAIQIEGREEARRQ